MASKQFQMHQLLEGEVVDLTSRGSGVIRVNNFPFFVDGTIPGEKVSFTVSHLSRKYGSGDLKEVLQASPHRVEAVDTIGQEIGTMSLQHIAYPEQLRLKQHLVEQTFHRIGRFSLEELEVRETLGMENPLTYRNKAQVPVRQVKGQLTTGFFRRGSHDLVPVENFYIQDEKIDAAVLVIRDICREFGVASYNEKKHRGLLRHIIVKRGHYTGQIQVILVLNQEEFPHQEKIVEAIHQSLPEVVSIVLNYQTRRSNVILGRKSQVVWGEAFYQDQMLGMTFNISAHSFYQVNTPQAEVLYQEALKAADLSGSEKVLDAYSGIGTIALALAKEAGEVYAMEIVPEAVDMARENARINDVENVHFEAGPAEEWLPKWHDQGIRFDTVVVDPPRKGLGEEFVHTVIEQDPERIVYVSCNPATCARDCHLFADAGYQLKYVQPVDLFPQTPHVECVVLLEKKS